MVSKVKGFVDWLFGNDIEFCKNCDKPFTGAKFDETTLCMHCEAAKAIGADQAEHQIVNKLLKLGYHDAARTIATK